MKVDGITLSKAQCAALVRLRTAERFTKEGIPTYIHPTTGGCMDTSAALVECSDRKLSMYILTDRGRAVADELLAVVKPGEKS